MGCGSSHHTCIFQDLMVALNLCNTPKCGELLLVYILEEWGVPVAPVYPFKKICKISSTGQGITWGFSLVPSISLHTVFFFFF